MQVTSTIFCALLGFSASIATNLQSNPSQFLRFLSEMNSLQAELESWKLSEAGQVAKANGFYPITDRVDDELERFFMTKLNIEKAKQENPSAIFSTDTPFTLMTNEEFTAYVGRSNIASEFSNEISSMASARSDNDTTPPPPSVDWTTGTCVAPVKSQGPCGSCWAFSSVGTLESAYCMFKNNGVLQLFSEQELTSCDAVNYGCGGGWPHKTLRFVQENGGIATAATYPYTNGISNITDACLKKERFELPIKQVVLPEGTEDGYLQAISRQPVSVLVAAGNYVWKQYTGGVVTQCPSNYVDHAVLAVGYDTDAESNLRYFKIKNSWSTKWGNNGFIYISREGSTCGVINALAVYPEL